MDLTPTEFDDLILAVDSLSTVEADAVGPEVGVERREKFGLLYRLNALRLRLFNEKNMTRRN